jgi:hypothetical protein
MFTKDEIWTWAVPIMASGCGSVEDVEHSGESWVREYGGFGA